MSYIFNPGEFACQTPEIVDRLLRFSACEISLGSVNLDGADIFVRPSNTGYPHIAPTKIEGKQIIFLTASNSYWCQYVYEFSHEFCHFWIGGSLYDLRTGFYWLKETLCELSSLYVLSRLSHKWTSLVPENLDYGKAVADYLQECTSGITPAGLPLEEYISLHWEALCSPDLLRKRYKQMAISLLRHFLDNPDLWLLMPHFSDIEQMTRLEQIVRRLLCEMPPGLEKSGNILARLLLSNRTLDRLA